MKINHINPQTKLITKRNNTHNNLNIVDTSFSPKENQVSFQGIFINKAKKLFRSFLVQKNI